MPTRTVILVGTLRELFRNLAAWRATYEEYGVDEIPGPDGERYSIHDIEYLVTQLQLLPPRQCEAIQFMLIENMREKDVAIMMGVSPTNPVGAYATEGIKRLIQWIDEGKLARFRVSGGE